MIGELAPAVQPELRDAVLAWYDTDGRPLAFRATTDPWAILVSEAMAQQTQAARAAEAWGRFLAEFPTLQSLAAATPAAVLRAWRGLGYNRRATALRRAAIAIVEEHGGQVPDDLHALRGLPGVGPYTARAVAALAFGRRVGAVDTNVRRVLNRAVGGRPGGFTDAGLQAVADASVPAERPGHWTHALMDVGATFCWRQAPRCEACPARPWCKAALEGTAEEPRTVPSARGRSRGPGVRRPVATREAPAPFRSTSRWLRGRILDALRDAPADAWARLDGPIGDHDLGAVDAALASLAMDGLVERHPSDPRLARLPTV